MYLDLMDPSSGENDAGVETSVSSGIVRGIGQENELDADTTAAPGLMAGWCSRELQRVLISSCDPRFASLHTHPHVQAQP